MLEEAGSGSIRRQREGQRGRVASRMYEYLPFPEDNLLPMQRLGSGPLRPSPPLAGAGHGKDVFLSFPLPDQGKLVFSKTQIC